MQLELFPWDELAPGERIQILGEICNHYWFLRNYRSTSMHDAARRKRYRMIERQKKRLLNAGVSKREILDYLACCRQGCRSISCLQCVA